MPVDSPAVSTLPAAAGTASAPRRLITGLIGAGIQRSLTPALHEQEALCQGVRLHYQLIDLDHAPRGAAALPLLVEAAALMGFAGLNITYPCKQAVIPLLDGLSDQARLMGAVNTVVFRDGRALGHNTDGSGWRWGFERSLPGADLGHVVLLGAGGAGSAIAHAVLAMGAQRLTLVDSDTDRAAALARSLQAAHSAPVAVGDDLPTLLRQASGLIHATPTGMDKLPGLPLPAELLHSGLWVAEIVYFPLETALLRAARERGCATVDGGTMAVGQAVGALQLITGLSPDAQRMDSHFRSLVSARGNA